MFYIRQPNLLKLLDYLPKGWFPVGYRNKHFFFSKYWRLSVGLVGINRFVFQTVSNHGEDIIIMVPKHLSFPAAGTSRAWWRPADHESSHCLSAVQNTRALLTRGRPTCKMEKPKRKHLNTVKKKKKQSYWQAYLHTSYGLKVWCGIFVVQLFKNKRVLNLLIHECIKENLGAWTSLYFNYCALKLGDGRIHPS